MYFWRSSSTLDSVFDIKNEDISPSVQIHMEQTNQLFYDHFQGQIWRVQSSFRVINYTWPCEHVKMYLSLINYESIQSMSHIFRSFCFRIIDWWDENYFRVAYFQNLFRFFRDFFSISVRLCLLLLVTVSNYILF